MVKRRDFAFTSRQKLIDEAAYCGWTSVSLPSTLRLLQPNDRSAWIDVHFAIDGRVRSAIVHHRQGNGNVVLRRLSGGRAAVTREMRRFNA